MIVLGRSHNKKKQGAKTKLGTLTEWKVAQKVNRHAIDSWNEMGCTTPLIEWGGTLKGRLSASRQLNRVYTVDAMVEVHCNNHPESDFSGFFVMSNKKSKRLAGCILRSMSYEFPEQENHGLCIVTVDPYIHRRTIRWSNVRSKRYSKASWLGLLFDVPCPSVIIECCNLSNPKDANWIAEPIHQKVLGHAIAKGLDKWKIK